jgi:hypothetical protein
VKLTDILANCLFLSGSSREGELEVLEGYEEAIFKWEQYTRLKKGIEENVKRR